MKSAFLLGLVASSMVGGCAAAPQEKEANTTSSIEGFDPGGGGGGLDVDTALVTLDDQNVYFAYETLTVCETEVNRALTDRLKAINSEPQAVIVDQVPHVVIAADGFDPISRDFKYAERRLVANGCYGAASWTLSSGSDSIRHIRNMDLSGSFGLAGKNWGCDVGFSLSDVQLDVKNLFVKDGKLTMPDVALDFTGDTTAGASAGCEYSFSKDAVAFAGPVPVLYSLDFKVRLSISADRATGFHGHVGRDGASIDAGESSFTITPQVQVGVTFYKVLGAYVGVKVPITITPNPPCRPTFHVEANPYVGAQLGLGLELGDDTKDPSGSLDHGIAVETDLATLWQHDFVDTCR